MLPPSERPRRRARRPSQAARAAKSAARLVLAVGVATRSASTVAARDQRQAHELRVLAHAQGAHGALEVGAVDKDGGIALEEGAGHLVASGAQLGKVGLVQHEVGQLRVGGAGQHRLGLRQRRWPASRAARAAAPHCRLKQLQPGGRARNR